MTLGMGCSSQSGDSRNRWSVSEGNFPRATSGRVLRELGEPGGRCQSLLPVLDTVARGAPSSASAAA